MWTPEAVKIRFVEAAGTERFLSALRLPTANGYWPEFSYEKDDRDGWDQQAKDDHLEIWQGRGTAKADALSRYQECLSWTIERITAPDRRRLVWGFAFCRAYKRDFGKLCKERGLGKTTAYNRLNRMWDRLSLDLNNDRVLLREAASRWGGHETGTEGSFEIRSPGSVGSPAIRFSPGYRTEKSRDLIRTAQDAENFAKLLQRHNAKARRIQRQREDRLLQQIEAA